MHSPNLTDENIAKIRDIFPDCVTEAKDESGQIRYAVDFDQLRQELSDHVIEGPQERYHLNWPGKREALLAANAPIAKTLRPCRDESVNFDSTKNLFIEGDNLEALKLLQETYLGKVKMIYIDPPYNTGNDFIYEDDFSEDTDGFLIKSNQKDEDGNRLVSNTESNGRFHSDWLSMLYPRLKLARNLLSEDGVVFISIDENEQANLRKLCDEIFGGENYISMIAVENNPKGRKNSRFLSVSNDFCLCYAKNKERSYFIENIPKNIADMKQDENGNYVHKSGKRVLVGENSFNKEVLDLTSEKHYSVYYHSANKDLILRIENSLDRSDQALIDDGYTRYISHRDEKFIENTYTKTKFLGLAKDNALEFKESKIFEKNFSSDIRLKSLLTNRKYKALVGGKVVEYKIDVKTTSANTQLKELFDTTEVIFPSPKNIGLIKLLVTLFDDSNFIVLDFFSGSASAAHAVMKVNADYGGNRRFILIQLPEFCDQNSEAYSYGLKTIAEIGKERLRRGGKHVIKGDCHANWNKDVGFRVLKVDTSNMADVYYTPGELKQDDLLDVIDNIKPGRGDPEDFLFQVLVDWGVDLTLPMRSESIQGKTVFFVNEAPYDLMACFDTGITEELVKELAKHEPMRVVFRDNGFASDAVKINVDQIFRQLSPSTEVKSI